MCSHSSHFSSPFLHSFNFTFSSHAMEAFGILKFWRTTVAGDEDEDDSFFDLVLRSPLRKGDDDHGLKKDFRFIESPRDVCMTKNDFPTSKPSSPAVTLLRSTPNPKLKIFLLGFRKSTPRWEKSESASGELKASPLNQSSELSRVKRDNRFSVKCRVGAVPISPVLARGNSLRRTPAKEMISHDREPFPDEKSVPMYMKLMKPFYVLKASKKKKSANSVTPYSSPLTEPVNFSPRKLSDVSRAAAGSSKTETRNLAKSRSASGPRIALSRAPLPPVSRRDDSLIEQQDYGIQGAILHCKNSYNSSSKEDDSRSVESPCAGGDQKRCSI